MSFAGKLKNTLRYNDWWNFVVPPLLGVLYFSFLLNNSDFFRSLVLFALFFISIIGTAGFGYFINDISDIEFDALAGKKNFSSGLSAISRTSLIFLLLLIALIPWILIPLNTINFSLFIFQLFLLTVYSVKPFRLKKNIILGPFADALYSGTVFILVIISTFFSVEKSGKTFYLMLFLSAFFWAMFKGSRNILNHQLSDRKNDRKSGLRTFVMKYRPFKVLLFIDYFILPMEILFFLALLFAISLKIKYFYVWFFVFILFSLIKFSIWKLVRLPYRQRLFKFIYFLNDFYEEWLPIILLIYLIEKDIKYLILLALHLLLFPKGISKFINDIRNIFSGK